MTDGSKELNINKNNKKQRKMKKRFLLAAFLVSVFYVGGAQAQDCKQDQELQQNLSIFNEDAKAKRYDAAYPVWKSVYEKCPSINAAVYVRGEAILKHKIDKSTGAEKENFVKDLLKLYEDYNKYFPTRMGVTEMRIKQSLLISEEKEKVYDLLSKAFKEDKENFKNEKALYLYFSVLVSLHEEGKKPLQDVFDTYDDVVEKIQDEKNHLSETINKYIAQEEAGTISAKDKKILEASRQRVDNYELIGESIDAKLGRLADCDNLIPLYSKNFEANKANEVWLRRAAGKMSDKDCTSDPLFVKIVGSLHELSPSASSAYYLGVLNDKNKNTSKAVEYYNESVRLESDNLKKSKILTRIASKHSKSGAVKYAQEALKYNPSNSDAYRIMAKAYADSANECGSTSFEKRAIYWLAASTARKGGLESLAKHYDALAPSKVDVFESGMAGKTISFKCWVGQSVKVPAL
ncbi:conserved exported hypothetical protein [Capnocytophaga cynodegmi]|uniref:Uncharacterized protein n=2 Tax=Capnocytophaga cynodegmi TaxID=28189 RepID=A0A0B7H9G4_9FLAO|nr:conserved exported hypothetical protein [Capnocytophaga cynodegmi]